MSMRKSRKRDRFLSFFLSFCLIFAAIIPTTMTTAYAAVTYKVTCTDSGLNYGAGSQSTFERSDGTAVYCGEHDVYSPVDQGDSASFSFSLYTKSKTVTKALYYGKGGPKEWSGFKDYTTKQAKCITALALSNAYIETGDAKSAAEKVDLDDVKGLKAFWNYIKEKTTPDTERFEVYRYAGDAWTQSLFTFEYYPKGEGTLVKKSSSSYTTNANGYYLTGAKYGVYKTKADANDNKHKVGTLTTVSGGTSNTLTLDVGTYYVKETTAPDGYELDDTVHSLVIKEDETTTLNVKDTPLKGSLQVIKKSSNSKTSDNEHYSLAGAEFKVYRDKEKTSYVTTLKTDKNGKTEEFSCIADTYYIYETKAPAGFKVYEDVITAKVTIGQETEKTVTDDPIRGKIQIKKVSSNSHTGDNDHYSLEGAKFSVYRDAEQKDKVATLTTDAEGMTNAVTCVADTYYVFEDEAPKGFQRIEGLVGSFDTGNAFIELGQDYVYTVKENPIRGKIQIQKTSSDQTVEHNENYSLEGATFSIYRDKEKQEKVATLTTDKNGMTPELTCVADTYYVYEDEAPAGFKRIEGLVGSFDTGEAFISLNQDYLYTVENEPIPGKIQIIKEAKHPELIAGNQNYSLEGAVFGIYADKACTKLLTEAQTDADGKTEAFAVYADTYYVKELQAPKGFKLNETVFSAEVTIGQTVVVHVEEDEITGYGKVKKVTNGGKTNAELVEMCPEHYQLGGAIYGIFSTAKDAEQGKTAIETLTTNDEGETEAVNLPLGEYYVKELTPSKGYLLDETIHKVSIKAGETAEITSAEPPLFDRDRIILKKVDGLDVEKPLAGAQFKVEYYPALLDDLTGMTPERTWRFQSDKHGCVRLSKEDYIGGDSLFKDADGHVVGLIGTYVITETKAPEGYLLNQTPVIRKMTMNEQGNELVYHTPIIENKLQNVKITVQKTDKETGRRVPQGLGSFLGAVYEIFRLADNGTDEIIVDTLTTDVDGNATSKQLAPGEYMVRERKAPAGYTVNQEVIKVDALATNSTTETFHYFVKAEEQPTTTEVNKVEEKTSIFVPGAELAIYDEEGKELDRWMTTEEPHVFKALPAGTYTLKELSVPPGYVKAKDVEFQVKSTGEVQKIIMEDDYIKVEFLKVDETTGRPLAGVVLQLLNQEGKVVDEWVTEEKTHRIDRLPAGEYVLHEKTPLDGYLPAKDKTFTVKETGEVQTIIMKNDYTKVEISKTDMVTGEPVIGAKLQILDADGKTVASWTTTNKPHDIEMLAPGEYTLIETYAPGEQGYVTAKDVPFTVKATGELQKVEMQDDHTKIRLHKMDLVSGEPVKDTVFALIPADKDWNPVGEDAYMTLPTDENGEVYLTYIPVGRYILNEAEVNYAAGYVTAEDMQIEVLDAAEVQEFTMEDDFTKIEISKTDIQTGEFVEGAILQILDLDEEVIHEWKSGDAPKYFEKLPVGDYILREESAPAGYLLADDIAFSVKDTAEVQSVEMKEDFTKIEIYKVEAGTNKTVEGAELAVCDTEGDTITTFKTTKHAHAMQKLPVGDYILKEVSAPDGYKNAEDLYFAVEPLSAVQKIVMEDEPVERVLPDGEAMPKTGDLQPLFCWVTVAFFSLCCIMLTTRRKRGKTDEEHSETT